MTDNNYDALTDNLAMDLDRALSEGRNQKNDKGALLGAYDRAHRVGAFPASVEGYNVLERILGEAYKQAAQGKGSERHAHSPIGFVPWQQQPILANARQVGPGGLAQQCMKKAGESVMMSARGEFRAAQAEALGVIVYAAALYRLYEEMEEANK